MQKSMPTPNNNKKRRRSINSIDLSECREASAEETLEFILGVELVLWRLAGTAIGVIDGLKTTVFRLEYAGQPDCCPVCGAQMRIKDYKPRTWWHVRFDETLCYIHAKVPRFE